MSQIIGYVPVKSLSKQNLWKSQTFQKFSVQTPPPFVEYDYESGRFILHFLGIQHSTVVFMIIDKLFSRWKYHIFWLKNASKVYPDRSGQGVFRGRRPSQPAFLWSEVISRCSCNLHKHPGNYKKQFIRLLKLKIP